MTSRERLMASIQGRPVDRPAVSFSHIGSMPVDTADPDPFNIYSDPSWWPLLELAQEKTDLIRAQPPRTTPRYPEIRRQFFTEMQRREGLTQWNELHVNVAGRTLRQVQRRDAAVNTVWTVEHLLKGEDDVRAYLELPDEALEMNCDVSPIFSEDRRLGERGIVMIDTADPLCVAASMMSMEDYTVLALTDPPLFHRLLEKTARHLQPVVDEVAGRCPGYLWRIYGPEFASEPYLPPRLFVEYVVRYVTPMIEAIHRSGGYVRIHCHGRLKNILAHIVAMGADALDPIEPPHQGDVELIDVRRAYGEKLTLFGNLESSEIEYMPADRFEKRAARAIEEGMAGEGRGFVMFPSACPYGRTISDLTLANYRTMVRLATGQAV